MATVDALTASAVSNSCSYFEPVTTSFSVTSFTSTSYSPVASSCLRRKRSSSYQSSSAPEMINAMMGENPTKVTFDPAKHLAYQPPKKIWSMKEIGLEFAGISPNAFSEPFELFTPEAIQQMRCEIFSKPVLENCMYSSNLAPCQLRGFAPEHAPFIYDVWRNEEVLKVISSISGIDLVPEMDFEIANVNISINSKKDQEKAEKAIAEHINRQQDEGVSGCPFEDDTPVVDWHTDSYPFVCVLMLSDCTNMIGGETAIRTGNGDVMKVRGPAMGNAVILQGRYIEHQALRAFGGSERITMVTSFRPKSALIKDDTVLTTVRAVSNLQELYHQYTEYRLEILEERIRNQLRRMRERKKAYRKFDTIDAKAFLGEQQAFLGSMLVQIVDEDKVIPGITDNTHLHSQDLIAASEKKAKEHIIDISCRQDMNETEV